MKTSFRAHFRFGAFLLFLINRWIYISCKLINKFKLKHFRGKNQPHELNIIQLTVI